MIQAGITKDLHYKNQACQHQQSYRHGTMKSLHSVFHATHISSLNLTSMVGVGAGSFAPTGIAGGRGSTIDDDTLCVIRKNRKQMLILRAPPYVLVWMIGKPCRCGAQRSPVNMPRCC